MISWTIALKGRSVNWDSSWLLFLPDLLKADLFPAALDQDLTHSRGGWENAKGPVCARIDSGPVIHSPVSRDEKDSSSHWQQLTAHTQCGHNHTLVCVRFYWQMNIQNIFWLWDSGIWSTSNPFLMAREHWLNILFVCFHTVHLK